MVEFNKAHKQERKIKTAVASSTAIVDWYDEKGEWGEIDVVKYETSDLWDLRHTMQRFFDSQMSVIDAELNNWTDIRCQICGQEDLAYRGVPFITWGIRDGYVMCPRHIRAYDLMGTPEGEIIKQAKAERAEIKELFE